MKKLLALVLALVMSMSLVTISNAAFKDADTIDNKEAVEVMNALGVLVGDDKGNFNADANLTRAQAAKIVCVMLLGKDASDALSLKSNFTDVSGWAESYIAYCASQGIVAGVGNGKFDPDGQLTGYQFAKMLLVALGYDAELESMIGSDWQVNVAKLSISAGLTDGLNIALSKVITRDEAAKMAFNTLKATMVAYTNGTKVETGDGTKVTVNATRYYVEKTGDDGYKQNSGNDNYMQFCEQYFSKLKLNTQGRTDEKVAVLEHAQQAKVYANRHQQRDLCSPLSPVPLYHLSAGVVQCGGKQHQHHIDRLTPCVKQQAEQKQCTVAPFLWDKEIRQQTQRQKAL